jgi:hypothetical protein
MLPVTRFGYDRIADLLFAWTLVMPNPSSLPGLTRQSIFRE